MPRKSKSSKTSAKEDIRSQLAAHVKKFRLNAGLSQEQLGVNSGLSIRYVSQIERGTQNVTLESMERISKALGIDVTELITGVAAEALAAKKLVEAIPIAIDALQNFLEIMKKSELPYAIAYPKDATLISPNPKTYISDKKRGKGKPK